MLAGRRLFLGDTDFADRQAGAAGGGPADLARSTRKVPPELERIVNKALARDPAAALPDGARARPDLTEFLYRLRPAVSSFDIATLVHGDDARASSARARRSTRSSTS